VLRTLDKVGGLDEYLLGEKTARVRELGMGGWKLRWRIMQTEKVKERFRVERVKMGLPPKVEGLVGLDGMPLTKEQVAEGVKLLDADLAKGMEFNVGEDEQVEEGLSTHKRKRPVTGRARMGL